MVRWRDEHTWFVLWATAIFIFVFSLGSCADNANRDVRLNNLKIMCAEKGLGWDDNGKACTPKEKAP